MAEIKIPSLDGRQILILCLAAALVLGYVLLINAPGPYDDFAKCISASGAKFYGTFWCSHCKDQKEMFGSSVKYLPYVECSNPDQSEKMECTDADVFSFPTWVFRDGTRMSGAQSFEDLSRATSCPAPSAKGQ